MFLCCLHFKLLISNLKFWLYQVDGSAHGLSIKLRTSLKRISDNLIHHVSFVTCMSLT